MGRFLTILFESTLCENRFAQKSISFMQNRSAPLRSKKATVFFLGFIFLFRLWSGKLAVHSDKKLFLSGAFCFSKWTSAFSSLYSYGLKVLMSAKNIGAFSCSQNSFLQSFFVISSSTILLIFTKTGPAPYIKSGFLILLFNYFSIFCPFCCC